MRSIALMLENKKDYKEFNNLLLYSIGNIISVFGTCIFSFALDLYVLKITGSSLSFAISLILGTVPMIIVNPLAGVIADKFDKKKLVILMDLLNGAVLIIVYLLSIVNGLRLAMIYISILLLTIFTTIFSVTMETAKPNIVSEKMLLNINSVSKLINSISSILGPVIGGLVFAIFDIRTFIIVNSISFIFSAACEFFMDFRFNGRSYDHDKQPGRVNLLGDIKEGFNYICSNENIKSLFIMLISLNFFLGFSVTVPLPYIINSVLKLNSRSFGIIQGAFPVGMIIGALCVKKISEKTSYTRLLKKLSVILSLSMLLIGLPILFSNLQFLSSVYMVYYCMVMVVFGFAIALIDIPISYLMQITIPENFRGRVMSIGISIVKTLLPAALLLSGILLKLIPTYIMPITGGMMLLVINITSVKNRNFDLSSEKP
ncbi:MFS transporter [Clostridium sp. YIM B02515]|uniref:MFS transporter n=1 Tax=Clostridium rhizosphaerae TaxID=2803861 RepID=A0ABS1T4E6_9CLOT|nr:MFS transporter [Clostridium rhizosphaerae]MBL4934195.1 MFS transporter [Clostridium rhizosphaerae]